MNSQRLLTYHRDQKGFMAAEWTAGIAFLLIPAFVVSFTILQLPVRKNSAQVASTAAARAYVQALDQGQAETAARVAAVEAISAELVGLAPNPSDYADVDVYNERLQKYNERRTEFESTDFQDKIIISFDLIGNGYCPGDEVRVTVSLPFPVLINPFQSGGDPFSGIGSRRISSTSTERIPDYAELADSETGLFSDTDYYDYENGRCDP